MKRALAILLFAAFAWFGARPAAAHPAPFSYLDLHLSADGMTGALFVHEYDAGIELNTDSTKSLLDPARAREIRDELVGLMSKRLSIVADGHPLELEWQGVEPVSERQSLRLAFSAKGPRPSHLRIEALLFPYDPMHQTFVNIYEDGALKQQAILDVGHREAEYYGGSAQGRLVVFKRFVLSGVEHILIGPDHILFLVGLLLLGGSIKRLALIVTAFTLGHSVTLSLAALDVVSPPSRLIEPLIALTIIVVGADNLLVLRNRKKELAPSSDIRGWLAAGFGLIHGFGFASVLKEFGLPQAALILSLFAFNVGVEVGQLLIVSVVAGSLTWLARRSADRGARVAFAGSIAVILAGLYWFVERTFFIGGVS